MVRIAPRNLTTRSVTLKPKTAIAAISTADVVPCMLAPKVAVKSAFVDRSNSASAESKSDSTGSQRPQVRPKLPHEEHEKLFNKMGVSIGHSKKKEVRDSINEFGLLFAFGDLDLRKTTVVKNAIKPTDPTPLKERYRQILPHQFEEMRKHLQGMLEIDVIQKSSSWWDSVVVLVEMKDCILHFCIYLCKLNECTVKDAYVLPRIDGTIDCLNCVHIFTSLDLKAGIWQVELYEASKSLTAFMVGPLVFFKYE